MSEHGFLAQAFVYLAAAVLSVPIARRLGLGSVMGYLLAGAIIGPFALGFVGAEGQDVMHFAEFGVVMMLFVIGLELQPALLWRLRSAILGLGGLQVGLTSIAIAGIAVLAGLAWREAIAIGLTLSLSSTAIVLQTLEEKGLLRTAGGQSAFSVLLFQDIAVIPMLSFFPLLATHAAAGTTHEGTTWLGGLAPWAHTIAVLAAVTAIVAGGRFMIRPLLRLLAQTRMREIFTAGALLLVIGIALLMTQVGLSPALGTFLAGVVLANSEYRHELESDIEPFKGLLLGLFFIAVGASMDFALIAAQPVLIIGLVAAVVLVKFAVLLLLTRGFRLATDQALLVAFALPQVGEFAFVLLAYATQEGVVAGDVAATLVAVVALSMAVTPLLLLCYERVVQPRAGTRTAPTRESDVIDAHAPVLIAGFGAFGSTAGRLLNANGIATTVLDIDSDRVDLLRRMGLTVYYGDATRHDLLQAAGAEHARVLVLALDSPARTLALVHTARRHFPHLVIHARAFEWDDAHALLEAGVHHVYRESVDTSARLGTDVLRGLGFRAHAAHRAAQKFLRHEDTSMHELTRHRADTARYIDLTRQRIQDLERMLVADRDAPDASRDEGWDPETLREEVRSRATALP